MIGPDGGPGSWARSWGAPLQRLTLRWFGAGELLWWLRQTRPLVLGMIALLLVALIALTQGAANIPVFTVLGMLIDGLPLITIEQEVPATWDRIVFDIRLPRVVAAGLVGAALAYSGATYQGVFRNPLAGPFLLGIASGAGLGVLSYTFMRK